MYTKEQTGPGGKSRRKSRKSRRGQAVSAVRMREMCQTL